MPKVSDTSPNRAKRLLIVCGPTATGKTSLAVKLAKKFDGELISADSRQIYRELSIVSGKDIPKGIQRKNRHTVKHKDNTCQLVTYDFFGVPLWLYDVASISDSFSVSQYHAMCSKVISDIHSRGKLPVVVGGTGLYLRSLVKPPETLNIPPDPKSRKRWESMSVEELQKELGDLQSMRLSSMNQSDRKNPRRLIRALEVSRWQKTHLYKAQEPAPYNSFWVGLRPDMKNLRALIHKRVLSRWKKGALPEVKKCLGILTNKKAARVSLGVGPISKYLCGDMTKSQAMDAWEREEYLYAKRQMTWFRKQGEIHWYDVHKVGLVRSVVNDVLPWYTHE